MVIFIIEDLVIAFLTLMIVPKVIWTILKIFFERVYIKLLNRRQRAVHRSVWRLFIQKVERKVYNRLDNIREAPNNLLVQVEPEA